MTEELKISIESLYSTFSRYLFRSNMESCPCCVSDNDKKKLNTKQLRELTEEDLSKYAFKAMTTWGDTDDFKHFLPRIFELLSTTEFIVDTFVVLGKLNHGEWKTWSPVEQKAIHNFLIAWWKDMTMNKSYFDKDAFIEIYKLVGDIDLLLSNWEISFEDKSFINLIDLIDGYYLDLLNKNREFKEIDVISKDKLMTWLIDKKVEIEKGFFYYDNIDKEFAEKVSDTLYMLERSI